MARREQVRKAVALRPSPADQALIRAARQASRRAYAPYSNYHVGAALRGRSGRLYLGCNCENAATPMGLCAERSAIANAVTQGERRFTALAIAVRHPVPAPPCGACRQTLVEFCENLPVWLSGSRGRPVFTTLDRLMPHRFNLPRGRGR